jgi:L-ribulokinase
MGTSICHMLLGTEKQMVEGMCATVEDGIVPGLWGYEAGQSAVGDIFAWFFEHGVPDYILQEARKTKVPFQAVLEKRAAALKPGESGLVALDWWNGNRSVLVDVDLTGLLLGMTLATRAEEIYRALIEATAFGTRTIIEAFEAKGITVHEIVACGGLPEKNHLLMQIYADVTGREIKLADPLQTCSALGAAMHGAVAAGCAAGGYDSIVQAAQHMARVQKLAFNPNAKNRGVYDRLYAEYHKLHDYFGRGANDVMKRLKALKREVSSQ